MKRNLFLKLAKSRPRPFEESAEEAAAKAAADEAAKKAAAGGGGGGGTGDDVPVHTQKHVNKLLAEERRKNEEKTKTAITQLETLKKEKGLTDAAKAQLETQIEDYKNSLLTKDEQAKKEREKLDKDFKSSLEKESTEKEFWRTEFAGESTKNQILQAARVHEAVRDEQLIDFIVPKTRLAEVLDSEGKPTGKFQPKVKFATKNDKGEAIELDLTVEETVKRMKDEPERFGNLFKSTLQGGLGTGGSAGSGNLNSGKPPSDPAQYRVWRQNQRKQGKL